MNGKVARHSVDRIEVFVFIGAPDKLKYRELPDVDRLDSRHHLTTLKVGEVDGNEVFEDIRETFANMRIRNEIIIQVRQDSVLDTMKKNVEDGLVSEYKGRDSRTATGALIALTVTPPPEVSSVTTQPVLFMHAWCRGLWHRIQNDSKRA